MPRVAAAVRRIVVGSQYLSVVVLLPGRRSMISPRQPAVMIAAHLRRDRARNSATERVPAITGAVNSSVMDPRSTPRASPIAPVRGRRSRIRTRNAAGSAVSDHQLGPFWTIEGMGLSRTTKVV